MARDGGHAPAGSHGPAGEPSSASGGHAADEQPTAATDAHAADGRTDATTADAAARQARDVLLAALRERDRGLGEQALGAAGLAGAVGRALGLPAAELGALEHAAALHDVGKLAIPDEILGKRGPLHATERAFVRTHPLIAQRIIGAAPALAHAAALVRSSQERWDGDGFPDGLRGEQIPLCSRIIAACSAYEAIVRARPYRAARSRDDALAELERCAGSQFDPTVVRTLAAVLTGAAGEAAS